MSRVRVLGSAVVFIGTLWCASGCQPEAGNTHAVAREDAVMPRPFTDNERLGRRLFFDTDLSEPRGQSCASCHGPGVGFTGPLSLVNETTVVYPGAVPTRFGNRKPLAAAYAPFATVLTYDPSAGLFSGGNFWDGRATGEHLGNPAADQALGPFLNPLEQNNPSAAAVVNKVCTSSYASLFMKVGGDKVCAETLRAYDLIGLSIAAYEASVEVSAFSSKYDAWKTGRVRLTGPERRGLALFEGRAKCANCHVPPLFTDFTFDNLGVPRNPSNPFYSELDVNPAGETWVDLGLGEFLASRPEWASRADANIGKQHVPTLRNVDKRPRPTFVKAFAHNGYFKSLESIVHFYNTRDVLPACSAVAGAIEGKNCWPAPEVAENVNRTELGDLGLSAHEEADLVAFLETLSDGFRQHHDSRSRSAGGGD